MVSSYRGVCVNGILQSTIDGPCYFIGYSFPYSKPLKVYMCSGPYGCEGWVYVDCVYLYTSIYLLVCSYTNVCISTHGVTQTCLPHVESEAFVYGQTLICVMSTQTETINSVVSAIGSYNTASMFTASLHPNSGRCMVKINHINGCLFFHPPTLISSIWFFLHKFVKALK